MAEWKRIADAADVGDTPGEGEFPAGYFTDGKLVGVASVGKAKRINDVGDELEAGATISPKTFTK